MANATNEQLAAGARKAFEGDFVRGRYETEDGRVILAARHAQVVKEMIQNGWKNVSDMWVDDFRALGFKVEVAQYVGGVRKTGKFITVITL